MNSAASPSLSDELHAEVDARLLQALDNFFQRSRHVIHDSILRALASESTPGMLAASQNCADWLTMHPDRLSDAFATHYRAHLSPASAPQGAIQPPVKKAGLELLGDDALDRQLAASKSGKWLTDDIFPEMHPFLARMSGLLDLPYADTLAHYSPMTVVAALSDSLDSLNLETGSGTLLLRHAILPLQDTLRHTYVSLEQFLESHGVAPRVVSQPYGRSSRPESTPSVGAEILEQIQRVSGSVTASSSAPAPGQAAYSVDAAIVCPPDRMTPLVGVAHQASCFRESLDHWQTRPPVSMPDPAGAPVLLLRQLQVHAHTTDAAPFDLAMLDAVAGLFEFILADPDVSSTYKSAIAQLQLPALRVALASADFFRDDNHVARRILDLLGLFSRRFPQEHASYRTALAEVESCCEAVVHQPEKQVEAFADAHAQLSAWLAAENARADAAMAVDIARLEQIERQELGTLLALENLQDLTARHPAPATVLRQLEIGWVPYMAALYVEESGEGPAWREAGAALSNLFLSLQAPPDDATREKRLRAIPDINSILRKGLLAQGAESSQLREFFAAITATQECWIRPDVSHPETPVSHFEPALADLSNLDALARRSGDTVVPDPARQQANALREGDWVDFSPPYEGLETARVAWVGVQGYLLFCDSDGETRFSLDTTRLAEAIRAGQAAIPEQSLTRKAMLRLREHLQTR